MNRENIPVKFRFIPSVCPPGYDKLLVMNTLFPRRILVPRRAGQVGWKISRSRPSEAGS